MSEQRNPEVVTRGYVSERGPFEINANPRVVQPDPDVEVTEDAAAAYFEHGALAEKYGEQATRGKLVDLIKAMLPGASTTMLLHQDGPDGMSLAHVWFGPNFELFRHSHPRYGDALYYVVAGEITMGRKKLGVGSTIFLPNGHPYKYTAGPAGVEILEFRAGGGVAEAPGMCMNELSLDAIDKLIDGYKTNKHLWQAPENIGDVAFRQQQLDFGDAEAC